MYFIGFGLITLQIAVWCVAHAAVTENRTVLIGEDVTFQCNKDQDSPDRFIFWYRENNVLAVKEELVGNPDRFILSHGDVQYSLNIDSVEETDEALYRCDVSDSDHLNKEYRLIVNIPPTVAILPNQPQIDVELGGDISLKCTGTGKPEPTIKWIKEGGVFSDGQTNKHTELIKLESVQKTDSGSYVCSADTGFGQPDQQAIQINVRYAPTVEVTETFVHTGPGDDVSIQCTFMASPSAEIKWLFNNTPIRTNRSVHIESSSQLDGEKNVSVLTINNINKNNFGSYKCKGSNSWGFADADITVSGIPTILDITSGKENKYVNQYTLQWSVQSKAKMVRYHLMLKEVNESIQNPEWREISLSPSKGQDGDSLTTQAYHISNLSRNSTYKVKLQAENVVGLGEWTKEFQFQTPEDGETAPTDTEDFVYDIDNGAESLIHSIYLAATLMTSLWISFLL